MYDDSHVLEPQSVEISQGLSYQTLPVAIVDRQVRKLRFKYVSSVKVNWQHHKDKEATLDLEDVIRYRYPHLFSDQGNSITYLSWILGRILFKERRM